MNAIETFEYTPFLSVVKPSSLWSRFCSWWCKGNKEPRNVPENDPATYSPCNPEERLDAYKKLLQDARTIYIFRNGTAVYSAITMSEADAINIMNEHGRLQVGTRSADFYVASIKSPASGIAVRYAHPQIVSFAELPTDLPNYIAGSMIRLSRVMDSFDLHVVARYTKND